MVKVIRNTKRAFVDSEGATLVALIWDPIRAHYWRPYQTLNSPKRLADLKHALAEISRAMEADERHDAAGRRQIVSQLRADSDIETWVLNRLLRAARLLF